MVAKPLVADLKRISVFSEWQVLANVSAAGVAAFVVLICIAAWVN